MNPYTPPAADVTLERAVPEVPDEVLKKIKGAWVAGTISGTITLLFTLAALGGAKAAGFNAWNFTDVVLIFGLAFGIYKKSRACAVSMLIYFVASKILIFVQTGSIGGSVMGLLFIYFYAQGISGTFAYHKLMKE